MLTQNCLPAVRDLNKLLKDFSATEAAIRARELAGQFRDDEPLRTWKDITGKYEIVARLVREDGDDIILKPAVGKNLRIPFARLCFNDRLYITQRRRLLELL